MSAMIPFRDGFIFDSKKMSQRLLQLPLLSVGFRLFFLGAALWAGLAMAVWIAEILGWVRLPTALDPLSWHKHEMIFGYAAAAMAGFVLTAVPNWTGRLPVRGTRRSCR